ncbi:efflux RND transporter periplasmic adaptor subunit [Desulfospira joergensenii]|uniref:efflux RND transporter periplasmic adaptor subunit n=1 Tax=Desulfospira joergensenii TaxID=53329 RepID=UPI0003B726CB|nr:efflux RND transporter periplasmic adaptor subunit [Desulfospira joergensenii]
MRIVRALLILILVHGSLVWAQEKPAARVGVSKLSFQEVAPSQPFIGTLYYERISHVSSEVSGLVKKIRVGTGDRVEKGMPMVSLDTEILDKEIDLQENRIEQADLEILHLKKNFQRMDSLYETGGATEKDFDDAGFLLKEALLKKQSAQTMLKKLMIQKRKSVIKAPFDGIVLEKNVDTGDWVLQGKALVSIGSVNDLFVKLPVAETLLQFISMGQTLPVTINAYARELEGVVENLAPEADAKTKNIFIKIRIPMQDKVAENMSATVQIPTGIRQNLALIPRDALVNVKGKNMVYTIRDEKAAILPVNIVAFLGDRIGADDAHFKEGMPMIVDGNERVQPGQPVAVTGEK